MSTVLIPKPNSKEFQEALERYRTAAEGKARAEDALERAEQRLRDLVYGTPGHLPLTK